MAVTAFWYGLGLKMCLDKLVDFDTDEIKVSLHDVGYVPNQDTDEFWDDATNEEDGAGYTPEGAVLASASVAYDAGTNVLKIDGDDITWADSTITCRIAVIYVREVADADSPLLVYIDFGADVTSTAGPFKIAFNAGGIATITPTAP